MNGYVALLLAILVWLFFNIAAPFAVLSHAQPINRGRLPADLLVWDKDRTVRFYVADLRGGYGFSVWAPWFPIVVFDRDFFAQASPPLVRFVIAHELAHFTLGHHRKRWFAVVTGIILFPQVRRALRHMEYEADQVAFWRTGQKRSSFQQLNGELE